MLADLKAFLTLSNLILAAITVAGVVWTVKSYQESSFANILTQMESCRQHPVSSPQTTDGSWTWSDTSCLGLWITRNSLLF